MTKSKTTKRALLSSCVALMLCFSMLLGTTYAWFTDTASTAVNMIQAGTLKVDLVSGDKSVKDGTLPSLDFTDNKGSTEILWEPGVTFKTPEFKIVNTGNLALKYQLVINGITEGNAKLLEAIKFSAVDEDGNVVCDDLQQKIVAGTIYPSAWSDDDMAADADKGETVGMFISGHMDENAGNEYQSLSIEGITVTVYATQVEAEWDSFGNDYDAGSEYLEADKWDGKTVTAPTADADGVYQINSAAELAGVNEVLKTLTIAETGASFVLNTNVDLNGYDWTPIGEFNYSGFDGRNYTVSNVNVTNTETDKGVGLFGKLKTSTVKNLIVKNVDLTDNGDGWTGGIAGIAESSTITGCQVIGGSISGNSKVGGIVGDLVSSTLSYSLADNLIIDAKERVGGLAGRTRADGVTPVVVENTVKNTIVNSAAKDAHYFVGVDNATSTIEDNTYENVTLSNESITVISSAEDLLALGGQSLEGTYILTADIDLEGEAMTTIGAAYGKELTIVGNGHKISNAATAHTAHNGMKHHGFFYAYTNSTLTISDLAFENITLDATADAERNYGAGIVVAYADGGATVTLDNVDVSDCKVLNNKVNIGDEAGAYVGYQTGTLIMKDCDSSHCTVEGETVEKTGAFIGMVNGNATLTDCTTDLTIGACNRIYGTLVIDGNTVVTSADELTAAVEGGVTKLWLNDGEYDVANCGGKNLTISGSKKAVLKLTNEGEDGCDYGFGAAGTGVGNYIFNGITIDTTANTGNYKGYAYMGATFNDCNFVGAYSLNNANDFVFNSCTFDFKNGYFWTWGANNVTFNGCIFNGNSKTILAHGSASTVINIENCTFAATEKGYTGAGDNTAAVEIDPTGTNTYTINFAGENTISENYACWTRIKDGSTGHTITGLN